MVHHSRVHLLLLFVLMVAISSAVIPTVAGASSNQTPCVSGTYLKTLPTDEPTNFTFENLSEEERDEFLRILILTESRQTHGLLASDSVVGRGVWADRRIRYRNTTYEIAGVIIDCPPTRTPIVVTKIVTRTVKVTPSATATRSPGQTGFTAVMATLAVAAAFLIVKRRRS